MAVKRNYRINLRNYGNSPAIMVSQYDENYDLVFEVYDGVVPATGLNAYTVKLVGRQPGNDPALKYEFTGTVSGIANNILSFTIDTTMTGRAGKGTAEIVILDTTNDVKFASFNLPVYVEKAAVPDDAIDADVERAQEIADEVQDIVDTAAAEVKGEAEAWAVGERDGEPVPSTDPTYQNNAKYYAEQAQDIADSIGIDATLSEAGKAADAKKTGDEISALKEDLNDISTPLNAGYVSDNVDWTHYGITLRKIDRYTFSLYGTATAIGNFVVFNGATGYYSSGTPSKVIAAGEYTAVLDATEAKRSVSLCYTDGTIADRVLLARPAGGTIGREPFACENPSAVFIRFDKNDAFGTEEDPSVFKFALYNGNVETAEVIEKNATAKDDTARSSINALVNELRYKSPYDKGPFCTRREDFTSFYTGQMGEYTDVSDCGRGTLYDTVISKFDALMAMDSNYITKTALGTASGTNEGGTPYTIYEYVFMPHAYRPQSLINNASLRKFPVILCDGSIHGFEKNSTYGLFCFLYDLVNNYQNSPVLQSIRNSAIIKIIPVVNPWGFDRNEYGNANGVNINRNFNTTGWTADEATGDTPFDQPESVIVRDWVLANTADLLAYFNVHTNGMWSSSSFTEANAVMPKFYMSSGDSYYNRLAYITERHIEIQTNKFADMYDFDMPSVFGRYQASEKAGTASAWATETAKAVAMTFEMFNAITIGEEQVVRIFSPESKKICSELIGNMIAQTIFEYSD